MCVDCADRRPVMRGYPLYPRLTLATTVGSIIPCRGSVGSGMAITRPAHLTRRQIGGRAFGERADLIRTVGMRNEYGEFESTETSTPIDCATSPPERRDDRVRVLTEGGVQLDALRAFWTVEDVITSVDDTNPGDIILFANERWRARMTERWGGFSDTLGVRIEGQTVAALATSEFERTLRAFVAEGSGLAKDHVIPAMIGGRALVCPTHPCCCQTIRAGLPRALPAARRRNDHDRFLPPRQLFATVLP